MRREDTDHLQCPLMQVSIPLTYTCKEQSYMIGAVVVTLRTPHSVMVNASGSLLDADLFHLTCLSLVTISFAIVNLLPTHHFVMELINISIDGVLKITEVFGVFGESFLSGAASLTGCSLSTSEKLLTCRNANLLLYLNS